MLNYLKKTFEITVGDADVYVGLHITLDRCQKSIYIDQQRFTETLFIKYGFQDANSVSTLADPHVHLSSLRSDDEEAFPIFPYQEIVGSLLYLATYSRPDIAQAAATVSKFSSNFREIHCTAVKRILKYLKGTTDLALCYSASSNLNQLITYADAGYAGDLDDRKSRSGTVLILNNAPVL